MRPWLKIEIGLGDLVAITPWGGAMFVAAIWMRVKTALAHGVRALDARGSSEILPPKRIDLPDVYEAIASHIDSPLEAHPAVKSAIMGSQYWPIVRPGATAGSSPGCAGRPRLLTRARAHVQAVDLAIPGV